MKRITAHCLYMAVWAVWATLLASCNNNDYVDAIPQNATALASIDAANLGGEASAQLLQKVLKTQEAGQCGIDFTKKIYLFETPDGNFGLCAKVSDEGDLRHVFEQMSQHGDAGKMGKRGDATTVEVDKSWAVVFNGHVLLAVGPVTASSMGDTQRRMVRWLDNDGDGITATPMFEKLDSMTAAVALVAQAKALPDLLSAPLTLGMPKDADASQVLVAASFAQDGECLQIEGETFSFNKGVNEALQAARQTFRPILGKFADLPLGAAFSLQTNVEGGKFLPLLQSNAALQALLAGVNTAIDLNNIMRSVDGDVVICADGLGTDNMDLAMGADLAHARWLKDVDYWKSSCPQGCRIETVKEGLQYRYVSGASTFLFGVSADQKRFFCGSNPKAVEALQQAENGRPAPENGIDKQAERFVLQVDLARLASQNDVAKTLVETLGGVIGSVKTIKYTLK